MQAQPTPVEFVTEQHTDFIFEVSGWPALLESAGVAALALAAVIVWYRRRRRRDGP